MSLKITLENDSFPRGTEFDIRGLGLFKNGSARTLSKEDEEAFVSYTGQSVKDFFKGNQNIKVEGTSEVRVTDVVEGGEQ